MVRNIFKKKKVKKEKPIYEIIKTDCFVRDIKKLSKMLKEAKVGLANTDVKISDKVNIKIDYDEYSEPQFKLLGQDCSFVFTLEDALEIRDFINKYTYKRKEKVQVNG